MTTVVIADDHPMVRQGLRTAMAMDAQFQIVGEAGNGPEAIRLVEKLAPDLLVLDLAMPGVGGMEVIRQVARQQRGTRVVVFSMHASEAYVLEALRSGASGYVLKEAGVNVILHAMRRVAMGERYLCPPLSESGIAAYLEKTAAAPMDPLASLTTRERQVLCLAAEGRSSGEIADQLKISPRTAETHRANLMAKLGLHNQTELVRFAYRHRILPPE
jgi:two-component system, NarL family, response regulator NreC